MQKLFVNKLSMMETFSHGVLNAPEIRAVHVKKQGECHWNGDINTIIRKFAAKKLMFTKSIIFDHDLNVKVCILTLLLLFFVYEYP